MNRSSKLYKKSVEIFEKGNIHKALEISKKSIEHNKKNSASLNFIGLLYYFMGDLGNAQKMWSMNYKYNGDSISKKYLDDSKKDKEYLALYIDGVKLYEEVKINQALNLFTKCEESHFNFINLNNYITSCYIKKGDYKKAEIYANKVFAMDRKNETALKNKKILQEYGSLSKEFNKKGIVISFGVLFIAIASIFLIVGLKKYPIKNIGSQLKKDNKIQAHKEVAKIENKTKEKTQLQNVKDKKSGSVKDKKVENEKDKDTKKSSETAKFNLELMNKYINSRDFTQIYICVVNNKREELTINEKVAYDKAAALLKEEGVKYFYDRAAEQNKKGKIDEAQKNLICAKNFSAGSYLDEHIIYLLGVNYEKKEDVKNALKYYSEYNDKYTKGNYEEVVLYKLAILNTFNDKNLAKRFAQQLTKTYPKSIYNNSKIKNIIRNK